MYIKIELSEDGIWGPEGTAGYNTAASRVWTAFNWMIEL